MTEPRVIGGRYEIGALLGYGGMAEVHQATDLRLGRTVAVKILRSDLSRDPLFQSRFRREAKAAGSLNHPSIVAVYDTGEEQRGDDVVPYIVMEFVDGRTLRDILTSERRIEPNRAMEIVSEVCAALDFSHRAGIVHRDVKPANVMITRAGAVKVMDFGIARAVADSSATMTQTAAVIGTAQYLSPEQARGETVDARSDVYSTGCLLYELVTGNPPFTGDSPVAVAYQHVRESAPVPSSINPEVPRALDSIVMKALAKNQINRYQTAGEMRTDLQRALAGRPVAAEPVLSDEERTQFIAATPPTPRPPSDQGPIVLREEEPSSGRRGAVLWLAAVLVLLAVLAGIAYVVLHPSKKNTATPPPPTVLITTVPNVVGTTPVAANRILVNSRLKLGSTQPTLTCALTTVKVSQICTQTPPANAQVKADTPVTVTILTTPAKVIVPSVIGFTTADAVAALKAKNLQALPTEVNSDQTAGTVIDQLPLNGQPANPGSLVKLSVANGRHKIPTDLIGKPEAAAKKELYNDARLFSITTTPLTVSDPKQNGKVQEVTPSGGAWVDPTMKITLVVGHYLPPCPTTSPATSSSSTSPPPGSSTSPPSTTPPSTTPPATTPPATTPPATTPPATTPPATTPPSGTPSAVARPVTALLPTTPPTGSPTCQ